MCFYNDDGDWTVATEQEETRVADLVYQCCECREKILPGEEYHWRFQQEHDDGICQRCDACECECVDWEDEEADPEHECKCEKPDYGETWEGRTCLNCRKFLEAVKAHELHEGCRPYEALPLPGNMIDQMDGFEDEQIKAYFDEAEKMHPALQASGYLDRLWSKMPVSSDRRSITTGAKPE